MRAGLRDLLLLGENLSALQILHARFAAAKPFSVLRCGAHLFVFAFSSRIPQVVPQTRFARLSIAIKVRHRGQIVSTARTVTRES